MKESSKKQSEEIEKDIYSLDIETRLNALRQFVFNNPKRIENGLVNLHIHTNESFSVFTSPTEAVWRAYNENVEYFGINDHYSIEGHPEFKKACIIAGIKPVFSIEAIAMDIESREAGRRFNDPNNAGRTYLVGKGVTKKLEIDSKAYNILEGMKSAIQERNRKMADLIKGYLKELGYDIPFSYDDVISLTPHGNATERHVVQALCEKIERYYKDKEERLKVYRKVLKFNLTLSQMDDIVELQTIVRARLVKAGMPCYVEEDKKAFTSLENLIYIYREYGSVPTYPFLGEPITEGESDLEALVERVKEYGLYAFDLFDHRTKYKRAKEILDIAKKYGFPIFVGTEHNTKKMLPLVGILGKSDEFLDYFRKSAQFIRGHQILAKLCNYGFIKEDGKPRIDNLHEGFDFYSEIGKKEITEEEIDEMSKRDIKENKKYFGIGG